MHKADFPKINKPYIDYHMYLDLWDFDIYTLMYAAQDAKLWLPDTPVRGTPLTLIIVQSCAGRNRPPILHGSPGLLLR